MPSETSAFIFFFFFLLVAIFFSLKTEKERGFWIVTIISAVISGLYLFVSGFNYIEKESAYMIIAIIALDIIISIGYTFLGREIIQKIQKKRGKKM